MSWSRHCYRAATQRGRAFELVPSRRATRARGSLAIERDESGRWIGALRVEFSLLPCAAAGRGGYEYDGAVDGRRFRRWPPRPGARGLVGFPCFGAASGDGPGRSGASPPGAHAIAIIPSDPVREGAPRPPRSRTSLVGLPLPCRWLGAAWLVVPPGRAARPPLEIGF